MATNKLMEAAADILSGSKAKAPAMPPQKLEGEVVDVGGPTPQNYKPDDDSAKIKDPATTLAQVKNVVNAKAAAVKEEIDDEESEIISEEELEEEDQYLLEINLEDLDSSTGEDQVYWLLALQTASKAWQIRRERESSVETGGSHFTLS